MKKVTIHSDGACHGNPGPGGWAAVLTYGKSTREISGSALATTNNRMELLAAIEALAVLKEPCRIEFFTDSVYLRKGITEWVALWQRNGWRTKAKHPVKNEDLWRALSVAAERHAIEWHWLKGHAGNPGNERCDELATAAIAQLGKTHTSDELTAALREFTASTGRGALGEGLLTL